MYRSSQASTSAAQHDSPATLIIRELCEMFFELFTDIELTKSNKDRLQQARDLPEVGKNNVSKDILTIIQTTGVFPKIYGFPKPKGKLLGSDSPVLLAKIQSYLAAVNEMNKKHQHHAVYTNPT